MRDSAQKKLRCRLSRDTGSRAGMRGLSGLGRALHGSHGAKHTPGPAARPKSKGRRGTAGRKGKSKKERTGQQEDESEICTSAHNKIEAVLLAAPGKALL